MKKTRIARNYDKEILEAILENGLLLENDLQEITDEIIKTLNEKILNDEERKELYEIYSEIISTIKEICINKIKFKEKIREINNQKETELEND